MFTAIKISSGEKTNKDIMDAAIHGFIEENSMD